MVRVLCPQVDSGDDKKQITEDQLWRPPIGEPYDWMREQGYPKFPRSWEWEEIVAVLLGIAAVAVAIWLMAGVN